MNDNDFEWSRMGKRYALLLVAMLITLWIIFGMAVYGAYKFFNGC